MAGIMLNLDNTYYWMDAARRGVRASKEDIANYFSQYTNTQISDFVLNVASKEAFFPSKKVASFLDKHGKLEKDDYMYGALEVLYDAYFVQGVNANQFIVDYLRENGLRVWLSVRMNDIHDTFMTGLSTKFDAEAKKVTCDAHRIIGKSHTECTKDYANPVVYEHFLSIVQEVIAQHDMDGLELDFMREPLCLGVGSEYEGKQIITQFFREVRKMLDEGEKRCGHKIMLSARVPSTPEVAMRFGYDVFAWIREKLIDVIIPTPRWASTDNDMPIDVWKGIVGDSGVKLFPGQEVLVQSIMEGGKRWMVQSPESALGASAAFLAQGADGVYVFNFYVTDVEQEVNFLNIDSVSDPKCSKAFLCYGGDLETILGRKRRNIVTIHDYSHRPNGARGAYYCNPLPIDCRGVGAGQNYDFHDVRIATGGTLPGEKVQAVIGVQCDTPVDGVDLDVYLDKLHASYTGKTIPIDEAGPTNHVYSMRIEPTPGGQREILTPWEAENEKYFVFDIPADAGLPAASILQIASKGPAFRVVWAELRIG